MNRLISLNESGKGTASYTYDLRGNRLTLEDNRGQADALENLKETNYSYNALDQLDSYQQDKTSTSFRYLPDGTRYQKQTTVTNTDGTKTTTSSKFISNGDGKVTFEAKGTDYNEYIRGDRVLLKKKPGSNSLQYYLYNGHGDVIGLLYDNGTVANTYDYDEFGNLTTQQEKTYNPFKYAGEYLDSESGLYYLNARYYDPSMGRFLNEDSYEGQVSNPLTFNIYAYVNNNPMGYVDPTGHITESYNDGALRYLLKDIRAQVNSKSSPLYSKAKAKVTEIYGNFVDENTYNYLFDLTTKTSSYENSDGKSDWAIEQLVSGYQAYELDEYIATMAMGSMGGAVGSGGKGSKGQNKGWIKRDTYSQIVDRFGKSAANKFSNSMKKGLVSGQNENGVKLLSGNGVKIGDKYYKYEIKIKGQYGDWRVYGNYDKKSNQILFDLFGKGKH